MPNPQCSTHQIVTLSNRINHRPSLSNHHLSIVINQAPSFIHRSSITYAQRPIPKSLIPNPQSSMTKASKHQSSTSSTTKPSTTNHQSSTIFNREQALRATFGESDRLQPADPKGDGSYRRHCLAWLLKAAAIDMRSSCEGIYILHVRNVIVRGNRKTQEKKEKC